MLPAFLLTLPLLFAQLATARLPQGHVVTRTTSANITERGPLDAAIGTCIKIGADIDIKTNPVKTKLVAGACICVDAEVGISTSPGNINIGASIEVEASGGAHFEGNIASDIASSILLPFNPFRAYKFAVVDICLQLDLLADLSNTHHDFQPNLPQGCCKRSCDPGFIYDPIKRKCVPGCPPGEVKCGNTCYNPNTKTCTSGIVVPKLAPRGKRDVGRCPLGLQACAIGALRDQAFECVDIKSDIESCGGCVNSLTHVAPFGVDCTALPNTNSVSCHDGSCRIDSCMRGFQVSDNQTVCEPVPRPAAGVGRVPELVFNIMK